jgi:hypothetical protein
MANKIPDAKRSMHFALPNDPNDMDRVPRVVVKDRNGNTVYDIRLVEAEESLTVRHVTGAAILLECDASNHVRIVPRDFSHVPKRRTR